MYILIMYVATLFELNLPQSENGFARYARSTIAYGPLLRVSGRTPLLQCNYITKVVPLFLIDILDKNV